MIALPEEVEGELMNGMGKSKKEPNGATAMSPCYLKGCYLNVPEGK